MNEVFVDPASYWPFLVLVFLSFALAFIGAHAVFHPGQPFSSRVAFALQIMALILMAVVWGYISFSFGFLGSLVSALSAWLSCCAGSAAGRSQKTAVGSLEISLEGEFSPAAQEDPGACLWP